MTELDDYADWESREKRLVQALTRAQRDLDEAKRSKVAYAETMRSAVTDAFSTFKIKPVKEPKLKSARGNAEVAVPLLSDTQLGKITAHGDTLEYTSDVGMQRVSLFADKIIELTNIQRSHHPVSHCVAPLLGDIVEGEDIFPGQQYLLDSGLYRQVVNATQMLTDYFRKLLANFETVEAYGVIGNHGRVGRRGVYDPETNMDRMVYWATKEALKDEPRIKWTIPEGRHDRNWYSIVEIGNYRALAIHGDQMRGHSGIPWYGFQKKINGWATGVIPCCDTPRTCAHKTAFNDVFCGHWHQRTLLPLNNRNVYVNGSTEHYNVFAQEQLGAMTSPSQWLLFCDPAKGRITAEYGVDLTDV